MEEIEEILKHYNVPIRKQRSQASSKSSRKGRISSADSNEENFLYSESPDRIFEKSPAGISDTSPFASLSHEGFNRNIEFHNTGGTGTVRVNSDQDGNIENALK
mmetsp:Transcript_13178/g.2029  ORF Transcript_13178/g.2029 Transcript_13178/m.2029 type:complete len:104 (+) Transcript_13178:2197-2508(+)